ncbi:lysoplasmalogenase [Xylanimonas allomyrinae]|uniref:Lysoplasmalogenase n=1 Tax=Xylanimonas allomyrinae TaxID=2509459 RepID=A0A4P6ET46_9MICO|nr:lysoplasmalogenase [Xylanimonas allomyrinae]
MALVAVTVVNVAAHLPLYVLGHDLPGVARTTQWLLMPLLAAALWLASAPPRPRLVRLALVALLWSWAGDVVPSFVPPSISFVVLMALFLVAQVAYVVAFAPYREASVLHRRRAVVVGYGIVYGAVVVAAGVRVAPLGGAAVPFVAGLVVYGAALVTMAVLATGVDPLAGIGGALFLVSDGLIGAAQVLPPEVLAVLPPGVHGAAVMVTYVAAQALLVAGVRRRSVGARV